MKIRRFDVVLLKNNKIAIIKNIIKNNKYLTETINNNFIEQMIIGNKEISKIVFSKNGGKI